MNTGRSRAVRNVFGGGGGVYFVCFRSFVLVVVVLVAVVAVVIVMNVAVAVADIVVFTFCCLCFWVNLEWFLSFRFNSPLC